VGATNPWRVALKDNVSLSFGSSSSLSDMWIYFRRWWGGDALMSIQLSWRGGVTDLFFFLAAGASLIGSLPLHRTCRSWLGVASCPYDELLGVLLLIAAEIFASVL